jgi:hypothetical protein
MERLPPPSADGAVTRRLADDLSAAAAFLGGDGDA